MLQKGDLIKNSSDWASSRPFIIDRIFGPSTEQSFLDRLNSTDRNFSHPHYSFTCKVEGCSGYFYLNGYFPVSDNILYSVWNPDDIIYLAGHVAKRQLEMF